MCNKYEFPKAFVGNCMSYTIFTAEKKAAPLARQTRFRDSGKIFFVITHQFFAALHLFKRKDQDETEK